MLKQIEAAEPDFISPHRYLRFAYFETGDYPNYIAELKKDALLTHDAAQSSVAEAAASGFAKGGERGLFEAQLAEQRKLYEQGKFSPYLVAQTEARLGDKREAIKYLTICIQSHDECVLNLRDDQEFRQPSRRCRPSSNCSPKSACRRSTEPQRKTGARIYRAELAASLSRLDDCPLRRVDLVAENALPKIKQETQLMSWRR